MCQQGLFVTICYLRADLKEKVIYAVDAGHLPIVIGHKDRPTEAIKVEGSMAVGIMEGLEHTQHPIKYEEGDVFVLYTDGVSEARNIKKEEFEEQRIIDVVEKSKHKSAKEIVEDMFTAIRAFQGKAPQHDDITVLVVKF